MLTMKMTLAACAAALSATVLASNAFAMNCTEMTGNQLLAAIERGQCAIETVNAQNVVKTVGEDDATRDGAGLQGGNGGKSGGYY